MIIVNSFVMKTDSRNSLNYVRYLIFSSFVVRDARCEQNESKRMVAPATSSLFAQSIANEQHVIGVQSYACCCCHSARLCFTRAPLWRQRRKVFSLYFYFKN